jgi:hypothetical protein
MVNFYHSFVPHAARLIRPLYEALKGKTAEHILDWTFGDTVSEPWSARQQRQLAYNSEFTMDIRHVAGKNNHMVDYLSRAIAGAVHLGIAGDQAASSPEVQAPRSAVWETLHFTSSVPSSCVTFRLDSQGRLCPVVGGVRILMPFTHHGRRPSQQLVAGKFWHGLKKVIRDWARAFVVCQHTKVHRHVMAPLVHLPVTERRSYHVLVDLVGAPAAL